MTDTYGGTCFCGAVELEVTASRKRWATAIAARAARGRAGRSTPSACGSRRRCGSRAAPSTSRLFRRRRSAIASTAEVRRPPDDRIRRSACRRVRRHAPDARVQARRARQLRRDRAADEGRPAQAQGLPDRIRGLGNPSRSSDGASPKNGNADLHRPSVLLHFSPRRGGRPRCARPIAAALPVMRRRQQDRRAG